MGHRSYSSLVPVPKLKLTCPASLSHENIIAILDIIAPPSYDEFHEVYLVQVS